MDFQFEPARLRGLLVITHGRAADGRGWFAETFRENAFQEAGLPRFVQDNHARSARGVLRGLHYQIRPAAIGKLVRCLRGRIFDVAVDIRRGSPSFGCWEGFELDSETPRMVYIPEGFAHGYLALEEGTEVLYKTTGYYSPAHDRAVRWDDPEIGVAWPIDAPRLSAKDAQAPFLRDAENNFE